MMLPRMSEVLGQQIVIENMGGADGMTGASRVARAVPDGYQLVLGGLGTFILSQLNL
jgi:tripartite-type tricarboxylate transporter receptor subunit TctC